jgi:hypothetical protein
MPYKDPEKRREWERGWRERNRNKIRLAQQIRRQDDPNYHPWPNEVSLDALKERWDEDGEDDNNEIGRLSYEAWRQARRR